MAVLEPKLAILDETDSGLDIDALKIVSNGVNKLRNSENAQLVITHYQRLLNYIVPDFVHVLFDGRIVRTGDKQLAIELEEKGYDTNPRCLECHTIGYLASDGYLNARLTPNLKNVSCESCHGRGDHHARFYSGQDRELKDFKFKKVNCVGCHNPDNSAKFEFALYWEKVKHGRD